MECIENCSIISTYQQGNHFFQDPLKWHNYPQKSQSFFNSCKVCLCTQSGVHSYNCLDRNHHRTLKRNYVYTIPVNEWMKFIVMKIDTQILFSLGLCCLLFFWFPRRILKIFVFPINCRGLLRPPLYDFVLGNIKYLETFHPWTNTTLDAANAPKQETTTVLKSNN